MNTESLLARLSGFNTALPALISHVSPEDVRWKPADGAWSILEIVCHLADEEAEDFRPRLQSTLEDPTKAWKPIDPEAAATDRKYNDSDMAESLSRFTRERSSSIDWLQANLDRIGESANQAYDHPQIGPISVGELFAAWVAHDQLHIRQIAKRLHQLTQRDAHPFTTRYAE